MKLGRVQGAQEFFYLFYFTESLSLLCYRHLESKVALSRHFHFAQKKNSRDFDLESGTTIDTSGLYSINMWRQLGNYHSGLR